MSDPLRPLGKTPPRAEPLQPDRPGAGDDTGVDEDRRRAEQDTSAHADEKQAEQEKNALDNVREGYD